MATIFEFFELPPELRNFVYSNLAVLEPTKVSLACCKKSEIVWEAYVEPYVDTNLLTISKQFKEEYEDEVCSSAVLNLTCTAYEVETATICPAELPGSMLVNISHMQLDVHLGDWTGSQGLLKEKYPLLLSCRLPNIETLGIDLIISSDLVEDWFDTMEASASLGDFFRRVDSFSEVCARMYKNADVDVGVYLREPLYHIPVPDTLNSASENIVEEYQEKVKELPSNWLSYRASLSQPNDQYPFYGMRLDFEGCGHFEERGFRDLLDEALAKWESESIAEEPIVMDEASEVSSSEAESNEEASDEDEGFGEG